MADKIRTVEVSNRKLQIADCHVSDTSGTIELTLWEEWINFFKSNETCLYKIFNLAVKEFDGSIHLSTCSETFVKESDMELCDIKEEIPEVQTNSFCIKEFDTVGRFRYSLRCPRCSKQNGPTSSSILKCSNCATSSKVEKFTKQLFIPVTSEQFSDPLDIDYDDLIKEYPALVSDDKFNVNEDTIINMLLSDINRMFTIDSECRLLRFIKDGSAV